MNKVQKMRLGGSLLVILAILSFISFIREMFPLWILPQQLKQPIFQILPVASTFFIGLSRIAESISGPKKLEDTLSILVAQSREDRAKEKVIRKLLEKGVIKEKDIIERTQTESLVTVFHYGKGIPEEIRKYFEKGISTKCKKLHLNLKFFVLVQEDYEENLKEWDDEDKLTKNGVMVLFLTKQNTELGVKWVSSIRVKKSLLN